MPKICYERKNFGGNSLKLIGIANEIIEQYAAQGYDLTLRQLYYQMVSRAIIPNNERSYKNLGNTIGDARMAGMIDWLRIVDRTREVRENSHWDQPSEIIESAAESYRIRLWNGQDVMPEVWIEKDALVGVIDRVCRDLDIPFFSCRGYTSLSEMWVGAMRIRKYISQGQRPIIFHLGDHDPSGIDMTRDIEARLRTFCGQAIEVKRLALNMGQIRQYNPPPNPAKITDSRAAAYMDEYGDESWELDALEPTVITELIREAVVKVRDEETWTNAEERQNEEKELLKQASERWADIAEMLAEK